MNKMGQGSIQDGVLFSPFYRSSYLPSHPNYRLPFGFQVKLYVSWRLAKGIRQNIPLSLKLYAPLQRRIKRRDNDGTLRWSNNSEVSAGGDLQLYVETEPRGLNWDPLQELDPNDTSYFIPQKWVIIIMKIK